MSKSCSEKDKKINHCIKCINYYREHKSFVNLKMDSKFRLGHVFRICTVNGLKSKTVYWKRWLSSRDCRVYASLIDKQQQSTFSSRIPSFLPIVVVCSHVACYSATVIIIRAGERRTYRDAHYALFNTLFLRSNRVSARVSSPVSVSVSVPR